MKSEEAEQLDDEDNKGFQALKGGSGERKQEG